MHVEHASRIETFRKPFGAVPADGTVLLRIEASGVSNVTLCYTYGLYNFSYHEEPMRSVSGGFYETELLLPHEPCLLFYWFRFTASVDDPNFPEEYKELFGDFETVNLYYSSAGDSRDGEGRLYHEPPRVGVYEDKYPFAYQITVYNKDLKTPDKIKGAIIYQIFPDRFSRDTGFEFKKMENASPRPERIYHEDWYEDVDIDGKPDTGYLACDFYGGSLKGITEKLDYIRSLGVNIIYLNPVCEARSSHRYDTADYLNVDPVLGSNEDLKTLIDEAARRDIGIIIDGVFSHTGADSRYFNKFGRYPGTGAYRSALTGGESEFRSWYNFTSVDGDTAVYDSWWGFPDLPNVNEDDLSYRRFIFGEGGVVDRWTSAGISGIRLDVSDELPDSFIRQMRETLKRKTNGEGILIGEVWEDASNKCSYGSYRDFLLGNSHDSVMGYPFRKIMLDFLKGYADAGLTNDRLEGYRERYPAQNYYSIMNLVSSHDVPRIATELSEESAPDDRALQRGMQIKAAEARHVLNMCKIAFAIAVGYIGSPSIYYGDEVLMEGYKDPFNRRTYPWNKVSKRGESYLSFVKRVARLRSENSCLRTGFYKTLYAEGDIFVFERSLKDGKDFEGKEGRGASRIVLIVNRGKTPAYFKITDDVKPVTRANVPLSEKIITGAKGLPGNLIGLREESILFVLY